MKEKIEWPRHLITTKYCDKCGSHLTFGYSFSGYSLSSGTPEYWVSCKCPNASWYSWGHYNQTYVVKCDSKQVAQSYVDEGNQ